MDEQTGSQNGSASVASGPSVPLGSRLARRDQLILGVLVLLGGAHVLYHRGYVVDDAYITFRYAHNVARGAGAVFNLGSYVKGYSNPLFMALCVLPELAGFDPIHFVKALGLLAHGVLVAALYTDSRARHGPIAAALGAPAMAVASACLALWYTAGLETGLYTTLVLLAVRRRLHEQATGARPYSAGLFAAAALTRPEGIIFFAAMVLHGLAVRPSPARPTLRQLVWYAVPSMTYGAELLFSKAYYGDYFPSTFYAKVVEHDSLLGRLGALVPAFLRQWSPPSYLSHGLGAYGGTIALLAFAGLCLAGREWRTSLAYVLVLAAQAAFIARVDGDWMAGYRFVAPVLPFAFLLAEGAVMRLAEHAGRHRRAAAALGFALGACVYVPLNLRLSAKLIRSASVDAATHLAAGRAAARLLPPGASMASFDVGGEGYAALSLHVIDTDGLTDELVAKGAKPRKYAPLLHPDLVVRHPNHKGDGFFVTLRRTGDYVQLRDGSLIERGAIMVDAPPDRARVVSPAPAPQQAGVVAEELPRAMRPGSEVRGALYWRGTDATREQVRSRRLWLRGPSGAVGAEGSPSTWTRLESIGAWDTAKLAIDRFTLRAPQRVGSYRAVIATEQGGEQAIGEVEIVSPGRLEHVREQLVAQAQVAAAARKSELALSLLEDALALGAGASARSAYARISVGLANASLATARRTGSATLALAELDVARQTLHRAYFECGRADAPLRAMIDVVGRERRTRILAALGWK